MHVPNRIRDLKQQSAMEYLMTYGWAILVIATVLLAMYMLGIFNSANFAPKATAGSCEVYRSIATGAQLAGECSDALPRYVAMISSNSQIVMPVPQMSALSSTGTSSVTVTFWVSSSSSTQPTGWIWAYLSNFSKGNTHPQIRAEADTNCGAGGITLLPMISYSSSSESEMCVGPQMPGAWSFYAEEVNASTLSGYVYAAGQSYYASTALQSYSFLPGQTFTIGLQGATVYGLIANMQVYNTSLSANTLRSLYFEGIGGDPVSTQHLIAWWPLNGNTNDYSGYGNNGQATSVNYTGGWTYAYSPP